MDTVTILRQLWRFRRLVAIMAVIAAIIGIAVSYKLPSFESRKYEVGVATARILVDTPASQVVDVSPKGSDSLGVRATLLSNLMVDGVVKSVIARHAGIAEGKLFGAAESADGPSPGAGKPNPRGYALTTKVLITPKGDSLPIIQVSTQAPDAQAAERLADASIDGLREYLDSKAVAEQVPDGQRLRVTGLGTPQGQDQVRGPRLIFSIAAFIFIFGLGCAAILMFSWLIGALRGEPGAPKAPYDEILYEQGARDELWDIEPELREADPVPWPEDAAVAFVPDGSSNGAPVLPAPAEGQAPSGRSRSWWGGDPA